MKTELKRRDFVGKCFKAGVTCGALVYGNSLLAHDPGKKQAQKPDPKSLTYCGFRCSFQCTLYKATLENNTELKKKAYEEFKMKEKYNIDFDPDKVFCFGCKTKDKPLSINLTSCTVRKCATDKSIECCFQCDELTACDKELWKNYPKFKEQVLEMQKSYKNS